MSGRGVARVVFAPVVIAFAITAIQPAQRDYPPVTGWLETSPAPAVRESDGNTERLLETAAVISYLAISSQADVVLAADQLSGGLLAAAVANGESRPEARVEIEETASVTSLQAEAPEQPAEAKIAAFETNIGPPEMEIAAVSAVAAPAAEEEPKIARADQLEEGTPVFASLGLPAAALDTSPLATDHLAAEEAKVVQEYKPSPAEPEDGQIDFASNSPASPSQASSVPMSSPLKLRALTRADIPPAEKFVSLGSAVHSDARNATAPAMSGILPPEHQRIAHDAPPVAEQPMSIGKRHHIDETKYAGLGSPEALLEALRHVGENAKSLGLPAHLWCADFMNLVLRKSGHTATGSRNAKSYLKYGRQIDEPRVGAIAIFTRGKRGGHIGIVRGTDGDGNPIIVSGNYSNKVAEAVYPKSRVIAYVVPR